MAPLPTFPAFVFKVLEPLSMIAGVLAACFDNERFITSQLPPSLSPSSLLPSTLSAQMIVYQLGNTYALIGMLGVAVLNLSTEQRVVNAYLTILAIADVGHLAATMMGMGWDGFFDVSNWNDMAWGNIGATFFLFVTRLAYLGGLFGGVAGTGKAKAP